MLHERTMKTLLLIDGNAIVHRAFHAIPKTFQTSDGTPTNAVYGFLTMLYKVVTDFQPNYIIICFDTPKPTFRKQMYVNYQAKRAKMVDELSVQFPLVKNVIEKAGIVHVEKEGYEADDLIGTLVARHKKKFRILILTGDKDLMQLVDDNVYIISPQVGVSSITLYDANKVKNKIGVAPKQIPDCKALMGDSSDNYSGAKGIGPKTACSLLDKFGTLENLLKNIDKVENERLKILIKEHEEHILLSKKLAQIMPDVPMELDIEKTKFSFFREDLKESLKKLEMKSLLERIFGAKKEKGGPLQKDLFS